MQYTKKEEYEAIYTTHYTPDVYFNAILMVLAKGSKEFKTNELPVHLVSQQITNEFTECSSEYFHFAVKFVA